MLSRTEITPVPTKSTQMGASGGSGIAGMFNSFRSDTPQLYIDIDRTKCKSLGVPLNDAFQTLQVYLGGYYVNDFNRFDHTYQVIVQGDQRFRTDIEHDFGLRLRDGHL
mgnify:CR=1 FL=1